MARIQYFRCVITFQSKSVRGRDVTGDVMFIPTSYSHLLEVLTPQKSAITLTWPRKVCIFLGTNRKYINGPQVRTSEVRRSWWPLSIDCLVPCVWSMLHSRLSQIQRIEISSLLIVEGGRVGKERNTAIIRTAHKCNLEAAASRLREQFS